jgi:hypothetical protein
MVAGRSAATLTHFAAPSKRLDEFVAALGPVWQQVLAALHLKGKSQ